MRSMDCTSGSGGASIGCGVGGVSRVRCFSLNGEVVIHLPGSKVRGRLRNELRTPKVGVPRGCLVNREFQAVRLARHTGIGIRRGYVQVRRHRR